MQKNRKKKENVLKIILKHLLLRLVIGGMFYMYLISINNNSNLLHDIVRHNINGVYVKYPLMYVYQRRGTLIFLPYLQIRILGKYSGQVG